MFRRLRLAYDVIRRGASLPEPRGGQSSFYVHPTGNTFDTRPLKSKRALSEAHLG